MFDIARSDRTEWILGFDGGCSLCSGLAREVEEVTQGRLSLIDLNSDDARRFSREAADDIKTFAPTLFRIGQGRTRAYQGARMTIELARVLGLRHALKLSKVVGEQTVNPDVIENESRRRLVKAAVSSGVAGLLIAQGRTPVLAALSGDRERARLHAADNGWRIAGASASDEAALIGKWRSSTEPQLVDAVAEQDLTAAGELQFITVSYMGAPVRSVAFQTFHNQDKAWGVFLSREISGAWLEHAVEFRGTEAPEVYRANGRTGLAKVSGSELAAMRQEQEGAQPEAWPSWPSRCSVCNNTCWALVSGGVAYNVTGCIVACTAASGGIGAPLCAGVCVTLGALGIGALNSLGCSNVCSFAC